MLSASGVTWNSVTKDCSANLQEPDGITDTAGMITCQFYPDFKWSRGVPLDERNDGVKTIRACTFDVKKGGCKLGTLNDWSDDACARYVRKEFLSATGVVVTMDTPPTKICKAVFNAKEVVLPLIQACLKQGFDKKQCEAQVGEASRADKSRTHFFTRSGGWHDCGQQGTPQIIMYMPIQSRSGLSSADYAKVKAGIDVYVPLDQWYNGWPMYRSIKSGYVAYSVANNPKEGGCEGWMAWVIDTADNTAERRESCTGVLAGYSTANKYQKEIAFMWKTFDPANGGKWRLLEEQVASAPEGAKATLRIECAAVTEDVTFFRAACSTQPAMGWGAR